MASRFLQIHTLTSYPAALLNRDDVGFAKRIPYGGAIRTRISSQCLKRHWRTFEGPHAIRSMKEVQDAGTVRSRETFERFVVQPLIAQGLDAGAVREVVRGLMAKVLTAGKSEDEEESKPAKKGSKTEKVAKKGAKAAEEPAEPADDSSTDAPSVATARTEQVTVLGAKEVDYLRSVAADAVRAIEGKPHTGKAFADWFKAQDKDFKKNLAAVVPAGGVEAAMFGRMVTSDILARVDASVRVAHAFTVHEQQEESDYFSAVDDLASQDGELGSGHINNSELTSGLYYSYVVVDVPTLVSNLTGAPQREWLSADRTLASKLVESLVHLVATVTPGAKLGSTAPYAYAQCVLVEAGDAQPRSLSGAFLDPVSLRGDVLRNAYAALREQVTELDRMYGREGERWITALRTNGSLDAVAEFISGEAKAPAIDVLAARAASAVKG